MRGTADRAVPKATRITAMTIMEHRVFRRDADFHDTG
jgi:hypothetical protein